MSELVRDLRHAVRALGRSRGFAGVAVLTLALGIGATTAIFTLLDRIALRPLSYPAAGELVWLDSPVPGVGAEDRWGISDAGFLHFTRHSRTLQSLGAFNSRGANLSSERGAERATVAAVTRSFFDVVKAEPAHGRLFSREEDVPDAEPVAVLGHDFWVRNFGADPAVVGSTVKLNSRAVRVVGVMRPGVQLPNEAIDLWTPMQMSVAGPFYNQHSLSVVARMRPGVTPEAVRRELGVLTAGLPAAYPQVYDDSFMRETRFSTAAVPLRDQVLGGVDRVLWILLGSVSLVLLIACVNVANLFLVRAAGRRRELAVRSALGARRGHLVRGAAAEGTVVALAGGVLGVLMANAAVRALVRLAPPGLPRLDEVALDARGVAMALVLALLAGMVMGAFPLLRTSLHYGLLREGGRGQTASRGEHALRGALVTGQMAVALVLLAAAGLMLRSFDRLRDVHPGFDPAGVTVMEVAVPFQGYKDYEAVNRFYRTLIERVEALPGVVSAGATQQLPLQGSGCSSLFVEDTPVPPGSQPPCVGNAQVAPGYFRTMGIPVRGRATAWDENERGASSVVVTRALADRLWPGADPIGKGLRGGMEGPPYFRVVGVTGDIRSDGLDEPPVEAVYYPMVPAKGLNLWSPPRGMRLVVKTRPGAPAPLTGVRGILREIDPEVPIGRVQSMDAVVAASPSVARVSFTLMLLGMGAAMALLLSVVGLYGVISYTVGQRTSEMGIRMALGARAADVTRLVVRQSLRMVAGGVVLGVVLSLAATRALRSQLFQVEPNDPVTLAAVSALLVAVALVASWLPARRAARVDPMSALRAE